MQLAGKSKIGIWTRVFFFKVLDVIIHLFILASTVSFSESRSVASKVKHLNLPITEEMDLNRNSERFMKTLSDEYGKRFVISLYMKNGSIKILKFFTKNEVPLNNRKKCVIFQHLWYIYIYNTKNLIKIIFASSSFFILSFISYLK